MPAPQRNNPSEYGSTDLVRVFRLTARQLQNWAETNLVRVSISRGWRVFSRHQAAAVGLLAAFNSKAVTIHRLRTAVHGRSDQLGQRVWELLRTADRPVAILTAANRIELCRSRRAAAELAIAAKGEVVMVDLEPIRTALRLTEGEFSGRRAKWLNSSFVTSRKLGRKSGTVHDLT